MDTLRLDLHLVSSETTFLTKDNHYIGTMTTNILQRVRKRYNLPNNLFHPPHPYSLRLLHSRRSQTRQINRQPHGRLSPRLCRLHHPSRLRPHGSHVRLATLPRTSLPIRRHDHKQRLARRPPLHTNPPHHDFQRRAPLRRQRLRHLFYFLDHAASTLRRRMHSFCIERTVTWP